MDYMMPEIDGIEAMHQLRKLDADKGRKIPIIVLTADATPDKKILFMKEGFDDYLLKPVDSRLLESVLADHLPSRLMTMIDEEEQLELPPEVKKEFTGLLRGYDISFESALKHLSGDVMQLARTAEFFIKSAKGNMEKLQKSIADEDYEAADYITKPFVKSVFLARIKNRISVSAAVSGYDPKALEQLKDRLSDLELKVAKYIADGLSNQEIANQTCYSYGYIKRIVSSILEKTDRKNRLDLRSYLKNGINE